jgi:lipid-binding SYLF domain-containing protein
MKRLVLTLALVCLLPLQASAATRAEHQRHVREMSGDTLASLYKSDPKAKGVINKSYGYAVFASTNMTAFFISGGFGYGVAHANKTGKDTFMQMASGGVGLGLGAKGFRVIFAFANKAAYDGFIEDGFDFSGGVDAAAKVRNDGGAVTGADNIRNGVKVYQLTEAGIALQVTLQGTKYFLDKKLNSTGPEVAERTTNGGGAND